MPAESNVIEPWASLVVPQTGPVGWEECGVAESMEKLGRHTVEDCVTAGIAGRVSVKSRSM